MDWTQVAGQLASVGLPSLGTLIGSTLGGPIGGGLGAALGKGAAAAIGAALGVPPTPQAISQKVQEDPGGTQVALAEMDAAAKLQLAELGDIANARQMQVSLAQTNSWTATTPAILTYIVVLAAIGLTFVLLFVPVDMSERLFNLLNQSYAALWLGVGLALQFWWGSSRTSQQKDQQAAGFTAAVTSAAITRMGK